MADRKVTDFAAVTSLASGYIIPLVDLSEVALVDQNKRASIAEFDARYIQASGASISGQLIVPSGTAAQPGIGIGEPDTGFYSPANNAIGATANGTKIFTLTNSTATFAPALTISGTNAVITTVSGQSASFYTVSGVIGIFDQISSTSANTIFTTISGTSATFTTFSGGSAVIVNGVQATSFSGTRIQLSSGTKNNPSVAVGEVDTGIYMVSDEVLGLTAGGQEVIRASSSGVVTFAGSGAINVPVGTEAQRPQPNQGLIRFNTDRPGFEGYNGTAWTSVGGGATGSGIDEVFVLNQQVVSGTYSLPSGYNASSVGPITIASGVVVTIPSGSVWAVI